MHSAWSDGSAPVAEMAKAARLAGYEYISITDHAKGLKIAGGIDEAQIAEQGKEIAQVNKEHGAAYRPSAVVDRFPVTRLRMTRGKSRRHHFAEPRTSRWRWTNS